VSTAPPPDEFTLQSPYGRTIWEAFDRRVELGLSDQGGFESPLWSDAEISGTVSDLGPYSLLNTVGGAAPGEFQARIVLRARVWLDQAAVRLEFAAVGVRLPLVMVA
jgi:hypothetical protein